MKKPVLHNFIFKLTMAISMTAIISGCFSDTSTRRKSLVSVIEGDSSGDQAQIVNGLIDTDSNSFSDEEEDSNTDASDTSDNGSGYEHCDFNDYSYYVSAVGSVIACQKSSDKSKVKVKFSEEHLGEMTCLIPSYKDAYGSSFYIGPAQCLYHNKDTIYEGTFLIDRYGYTSSHFNMVMIMKYSLVDDYFNCMLGYTSCDTFKNNGGYIDYPF